MTSIKPRIFRLNSFFGQKRGRKYINKYFCKSRSFKANFTNAEFRYVNLRGSILTSCCFRNAIFNGVDFLGTNLRRSNFEGVHFKNTIFVGALLDGCNFRNATFENVFFVNTNIKTAKRLNVENPTITVLNEYPNLNISPKLKATLDELKLNEHIFKYKTLHINTRKYNHLSLMILLNTFSEHELIDGLSKANTMLKKDICTVSSLTKYLGNILKS